MKYNLIGLLNTAVTVMVVFVLHQGFNIPVIFANFLGYVAGGINSYWLNRTWNFKSQNAHGPEIIRFLVVFGVSYLLNLGVLLGAESAMTHWQWIQPAVIWLTQWFKIGFLAHLVANVVYVVVSYTMYRKWVFKLDHYRVSGNQTSFEKK